METNTMRKTSRLRFTCATAFPLRLLLQLPAAIGASSTLWSQGWRWPVKASWVIYAVPCTSSIDSGFFYFCNCFGLWEIKARQNFNNHEKLHHRSSEFTKFESMSGPPVNLQIAVRGPPPQLAEHLLHWLQLPQTQSEEHSATLQSMASWEH